MEICFKILLLTEYSFDLPGIGKSIDRMEHFENQWWSDLNGTSGYCIQSRN